MDRAYGQLLDNATTLWVERSGWWPGKWATVAVLRLAARDSRFHQAVADRVTGRLFGTEPVPPPVPTLHDLVSLAFTVVLTMYGPSLPFGGYWVRAARDFVLQYLDLLVVPVGLTVGAVR